MPKECFYEKLFEIRIIGKSFRIVLGDPLKPCDVSTYILKKDDFVGIIQKIPKITLLFKDILIIVNSSYDLRDQVSEIIKSELEGSISSYLLGLNA